MRDSAATVTLPDMPRRKKSIPDVPPAESAKTDTLRVDEDLAKMVTIISIRRDVSASKIVSPLLRPLIEKLFAEVVDEMNREVRR